MRRIASLLASPVLLSLSPRAWAHGECEALGHHWEIPAYTAEMRLQMAVMVGVACLLLASSFVRKATRRRRARR